MKIYKILAVVMVMGLTVSCKKNDDLVYEAPDTKGASIQPLPQDIWIRDSLTIPYNMSVKYKWDASELDFYKTLVPSKESAIVPSLFAVKQVWIDTYIQEAGVAFFKKLCPKQLVLVGSADYQTDGSAILGTAEAGRKVVLYNINNLDMTNADGSFVKFLHVIEHEFTHILHQTTMYPASYKKITPGYTANWANNSLQAANNMGFITPYAMATSDEDVAEMVSTIITTDRAKYDAMINSISSADGRAALRLKESILVSYFNDIWGIDIYALQSKTVAAINYVTTH